jgi:hypothetical protein
VKAKSDHGNTRVRHARNGHMYLVSSGKQRTASCNEKTKDATGFPRPGMKMMDRRSLTPLAENERCSRELLVASATPAGSCTVPLDTELNMVPMTVRVGQGEHARKVRRELGIGFRSYEQVGGHVFRTTTRPEQSNFERMRRGMPRALMRGGRGGRGRGGEPGSAYRSFLHCCSRSRCCPGQRA